jgi:CDP-glucose 4,6-dehydratase
MVNEEFWRGRRVLVTGHAGFKGSWLCAWLVRLGAEVTGVGHPPARRPSLFEAAGLAGRVGTHDLDVRDGDVLARAIAAARPEVVFHLAGQPLVLTAVRDPVGTFATNVMGTVNLLEVVRYARSVRAVVVVTSDKCYRDGSVVCDEDSPLGGEDPYGASKACAEIATAAYRATFLAAGGVAVTTARAGNVIGGGDMAEDRLIPDLVRAQLAGEPAVLRQAGAIRPWQHVLDALAGYLGLAEMMVRDPDGFAGPWNFGPDARSAVTAGEVAAMFLQALGGGGATGLVRSLEPPRHEAAVLRLSAARAWRRLGWRPRLSTAEAVRWTAEGYSRFLRGGEAGWLDDQIGRYEGWLAAAAARGEAGQARGELLSYARA